MRGKSWNIHAKLVCVDGKLVFAGSDNIYPHYHKGFGCWVEEANVRAFMERYYDEIWTLRSLRRFKLADIKADAVRRVQESRLCFDMSLKLATSFPYNLFLPFMKPLTILALSSTTWEFLVLER